MPRFYETTLSITNLHNLSISTHVNRSRIIYAMIESEEITVSGYFALHITSFPQRLKDLRNTTLFLFHIGMNI